MFITPTPFNTILWRIVVLTEDGYLEGFDSLFVDEGEMALASYPSDTAALREASDVWAVARLRWFATDFLLARVEDGRLFLSDLRMGQEPVYFFTHIVAARGNPHWLEVTPVRVPVSVADRALAETWRRIWSE